jgi:methylated-DNA-[protein]-cysteine S-methyltransferase
MHYLAAYPSPIGEITLACDEGGKNLIGLWIEGQKYHGGTAQAMAPSSDISLFDAVKGWLDRYFAGKKPDIRELPLAPIGGEFRQAVWNALREIPYGEVTTYGAIAKKVAAKLGRKSMSGQAVGGAVGHNPLSIVIPCHRVVGSNGSLTGFSAGVETKIKLLELEGIDTSRFFVPKKGAAI